MYFLDGFHTEIKRTLPTDTEDFAALVLISSLSLFPAIYGDGVGGIMQHLFDYTISSLRTGYEIAGAHEEEYLTTTKTKVQKTLICYLIGRN
jgi:hypothetical protein